MTDGELDPLIHVPTRLKIVATLAALPDGDTLSFTRLQDLIGLPPGNLIIHLRKLEDADYISSEKTRNGTVRAWRPGTCIEPSRHAPKRRKAYDEGTQSGAWVQEAAMRLRPHRRNMVAWSLSVGPAGGYGAATFRRPARTGRIRRCIRTAALLTVIGLMRVARAVRTWRLLLAGVVLTAVGVMLRSGLGSLLFFPGVFLILSGLLTADPTATRKRRSELEHELAAYSTPAQRSDLEATLDQYPDGITHELRDILANQALAARENRLPAALLADKPQQR